MSGYSLVVIGGFLYAKRVMSRRSAALHVSRPVFLLILSLTYVRASTGMTYGHALACRPYMSRPSHWVLTSYLYTPLL